jgi:hypothetical protein
MPSSEQSSYAGGGKPRSLDESIQSVIDRYGRQGLESMGIFKALDSMYNYWFEEASSASGLQGRVYTNAEYVVKSPEGTAYKKISTAASDAKIVDEISILAPRDAKKEDLEKFVQDLKALRAKAAQRAQAGGSATKKE